MSIEIDSNQILLVPPSANGYFVSYDPQQALPLILVFRHLKTLDIDIIPVEFAVIMMGDRRNTLRFNALIISNSASSDRSRLIGNIAGRKGMLAS